MSDYEITLPDGRAIVVDAPDEKSARQAAQNFMMRDSKPKTTLGKVGKYAKDVLTEMGQGLTLGFGDEIGAAVDASLQPLGLQAGDLSQAPDWRQRYDENLANTRVGMGQFREENPAVATTANIAGNVAGISQLPAKTILAKTLPGMMAKGATAGGLIGGAQGFGEGEGGIEERGANALKHGVIGMGVGALAPPLVAGAGAGARALVESTPGMYVADKVIAPGMRAAADTLDKFGKKVKPGNLSAAAPEGGSLPMSGPFTDSADWLRSVTPNSSSILDDAVTRRITDATSRGGVDVPGMGQRLTELGEGAMLLDAGNPMVQRLGRTAYISPGSAPRVMDTALDARNRETGLRVGRTVQRAMGDSQPAVLEAERLRTLRSGEGRTNYAEAVGPDAPYRISPEMRQIMQEAPDVQVAMDAIEANAARKGIRLTPAQIAHRVKQQLQDDTEAAFRSGRAINKDDVRVLSERWRAALHEANPAIREADAAWQAATNRMDALDLGRQFMRQGAGEIADAVSPAVLAERIPRMTAEEAQAFIAGAADTLITKTNSGPRAARQVASAIDENQNLRHKLVSMLGQDNANLLFNRAMAERTFARTDRAVRGGSDTAGKLLSALDDAASGDIPTSASSIASRLLGKIVGAYNQSKAGNEDVRRRIAEMLTDTDASANAELLDKIAAQLSMRARTRGKIQRGSIGTSAGVSGQE